MASTSDRDADELEPGSRSVLFREVNERIRELEGERPVADYGFVCECEDDRCTDVLRMSGEQYRALRAARDLFIVLPGHERPSIEDVVARSDGYVTVRKRIVAC